MQKIMIMFSLISVCTMHGDASDSMFSNLKPENVVITRTDDNRPMRQIGDEYEANLNLDEYNAIDEYQQQVCDCEQSPAVSPIQAYIGHIPPFLLEMIAMLYIRIIIMREKASNYFSQLRESFQKLIGSSKKQ